MSLAQEYDALFDRIGQARTEEERAEAIRDAAGAVDEMAKVHGERVLELIRSGTLHSTTPGGVRATSATDALAHGADALGSLLQAWRRCGLRYGEDAAWAAQSRVRRGPAVG